MIPPGAAATPPRSSNSVTPVGAVLAVAATALVCAAIAIIASRVGPLTVHPRTAAIEPPQVGGDTAPPDISFVPPAQGPSGTGGQWLWWIGLGLGILILLAIVRWLVQALRRPSRPTPMAPPSSTAQLIDAMLGDLAEPSAADLGDARTFQAARAADDIIASWEIVEKAATAFGFGRPAAATPTEFLRNLVTEAGDADVDGDRLGYIDDAVRSELLPTGRTVASAVLLKLYHRARFDTVTLAPGAATVARAAARSLVESWDLSQRKLAEAAAAAEVGTADGGAQVPMPDASKATGARGPNR